MRSLRTVVVIAVLAFMPVIAHATILPATNLDTLSLGAPLQQTTSSFMTADLTSQGGPAPVAIGQLVSSVYFDKTTNAYAYVLSVTPLVASETRLSTGFLPTVSGNLAGWSFSNAAAAGAPAEGGTAFTEVLNTTNLSWSATSAAITAGLWNASHLSTIAFFFESAAAPTIANYNLGGVQVGSASGYAPGTVSVAEPGSLLLMVAGLIGVGAWARRRSSSGHLLSP